MGIQASMLRHNIALSFLDGGLIGLFSVEKYGILESKGVMHENCITIILLDFWFSILQIRITKKLDVKKPFKKLLNVGKDCDGVCLYEGDIVCLNDNLDEQFCSEVFIDDWHKRQPFDYLALNTKKFKKQQ